MAFSKIKAPISEDQALDKLSTLCAAAEHCRQEMVEKCQKWGLSDDAAERVADRLVAERFVDDRRYAPLYVRDKARFGGWGPIKIRMQLKAKGIDTDIINDAIDSFSTTEWEDILRHALEQKLRTTKKDDPQKLFASLVRFGMQRGYDYSAIRKALSGIVEETNEDLAQI